MTGSPSPAPHRETGAEDVNDHIVTQAESSTSNFDLPALNSMRPTAPPSRPYGRYAVGLRPSLDPDAYIDAPNQDQEAPKQAKANASRGLDQPHSFRNDQRKRRISVREPTRKYAKLPADTRQVLMASTEAVSPLLGVPTRPGRGTCWRGASTGSDLADRAGRLSGRSHFLHLCG